MNLGNMDLEDAAQAAAGNWRSFDCFFWLRGDDLPDAENWTVIYTHHRDSDLMDQSNAAAIEAELDTFTQGNNPDVVAESHSHFLVGWMGGFSIRVFKRGRITEAFRKWHELAQRLADYPVLNTDDYSRRQYEATLDNLPEADWPTVEPSLSPKALLYATSRSATSVARFSSRSPRREKS